MTREKFGRAARRLRRALADLAVLALSALAGAAIGWLLLSLALWAAARAIWAGWLR